MRRTLMLVLVVGCSPALPHYPEMDGQSAAVAVVWNEVFGRTDEVPAIEWKTGAQLTCPSSMPVGWTATYRTDLRTGLRAEPFVVCLTGLEVSTFHVQISRWEGAPYSATGMSHEFAHAALERDGLPPDFTHAGPVFAPGGPVARGEARLRELGQ